MCVKEGNRTVRVGGGVGPAQVAEYGEDEEECHVGDGVGGCGSAVAVDYSWVVSFLFVDIWLVVALGMVIEESRVGVIISSPNSSPQNHPPN